MRRLTMLVAGTVLAGVVALTVQPPPLGATPTCAPSGGYPENAAGAPANDDFVDAQLMNGNEMPQGHLNGTLVDATTEVDASPAESYDDQDEYDWDSPDSVAGAFQSRRSVWYCFVAPFDGNYQFTVEGIHGDFDGSDSEHAAAVAVWRADSTPAWGDLDLGNFESSAVANAAGGGYYDRYRTYVTVLNAEVGDAYVVRVSDCGYCAEYAEGPFTISWFWDGPDDELQGQELLDAYAPHLKYDTSETYHADSPSEATDAQDYLEEGHTNALYDEYDNVLAVSNYEDPLATNNPSSEQLALSYLGEDYADANPASSTDYISEFNDYHEDYEAMHSTYADFVMGNIVKNSDGTTTLQYWMYYYYNELFAANHEGDWEMVQVHLDEFYDPESTTYNQHEYAETCPWADVELFDYTHPTVYVGAGTHASYYIAGEPLIYHFDEYLGWVWTLLNDVSDGQGDVVDPSVWNVSNRPQWILWPGHWGDTDGEYVGSPPGPFWQDSAAFLDPQGWAASRQGCSHTGNGLTLYPPSPRAGAGQMGQSSDVQLPPAPPKPTIDVQRQGDRVVIKYALPAETSWDARPKWLLTSVDPSGDKFTPYTLKTRIGDRNQGRIVRPLGPGNAPFTVRAATISPHLRRSPFAVRMIR